MLYPHTLVRILLIPIATVFLSYSLVFLDSNSVVAIVSYVISVYTLTIWCVQIPKAIVLFKSFKDKNKYIRAWVGDVRLRVKVSLYGSFVWNTAYAIFQLCLGLYHSSVWYYSLSGYYICLALMRFFLMAHVTKHKHGEQIKKELIEYRTCGWILLIINLTISAMVFLMIYQNKATVHHEITTIAMATYTFAMLTTAFINTVKYRKYESPVYSASKIINLAATCVSMITLTSTMLSSFSDGTTDPLFRICMLAGLGSAVGVFITTMAIYMIVKANRQINQK